MSVWCVREIFDRHFGGSHEARLRDRLVEYREPEGGGRLVVIVHEIRALDPERRTPGGFAFDPDNGKGVGIDPYSAADEVLVRRSRLNGDHVCCVTSQMVQPSH